MRIWDDNPSLDDLLGFDAVIAPIRSALASEHVDPLTIGIQSPWGGGKSTLLELLEKSLAHDSQYVVIRIDPWQFDNHDDVRGTLIAEILDEIRNRFDTTAGVSDRVTELLKRVSWSRLGTVLGKGLLTMQWKPDELIEAFTPQKRSSPDSMTGFKDAFSALLQELPGTRRVVVLVDDLDRCLPAAVMATLEAIKLFLAVPKTVFVLAADQDMVRDAIASNLSSSRRNDAFAGRYLEKIVQLPISLPRLAPSDAEAYIGLLLAKLDAPAAEDLAAVVAHASKRRHEGKHPLLAGWSIDAKWRPSEENLALAAQFRQGLTADRLANPRQIKRFLNAYGVRASIASARNVKIPPAVLIKMLLLEDQHKPSFEKLAGTPATDRRKLLNAWETWARGDSKNPPSGIPETTRDWAIAEPSLTGENLGSYLNLAASLLNVHAGGQVSDEIVGFVESLLGSSDAVRNAALVQVLELTDTDQSEAIAALFAHGRLLEDPNSMFVAAARWARAKPDLGLVMAEGIREVWSRMTPAAVVEIWGSEVAELQSLVTDIAQDTTLDPGIVEAAKIELGQ
jgi:hypothetical protein